MIVDMSPDLEKMALPVCFPDFARYRSLFLGKGNTSVLRVLQYEQLFKAEITGAVLDVGGGDKADYRSGISCDEYESINIDPDMKPTWLIKVGDPFPCQKGNYDCVVSMNTIEHVYDATFMLEQIVRALKSGGTFLCSVPFLYPVHGHPDDFARYTASWWHIKLSSLDFTDIEITPLVWGPFSTRITCTGLPGPFKKQRKHMALLMDMLYAKAHAKNMGHYDKLLSNFPVGYFIQAVKK